MHPKFDRRASGIFLLLGLLLIGIVILSGCVGQEDEMVTPTATITTTPTKGISVTMTIQPNPMIPTRTTSYTLTDYRSHSSWANAIADDGNVTGYNWNDGATYAYDRIDWEWDVGYPGALKQLRYEVAVISGGAIYDHTFKIYEHNGGESMIFGIDSNKTTNGTWTALSNTHWIGGKVYAHYEFEETAEMTHSAEFDVMVLEFNPITEEHLTSRHITETGVYEVLHFTIKQNDVDVTISGIPTSYQLIQIIPENSYLSVSDDIASSGSLTMGSCSLGTYKVVLKTSD